MKKRSKAAVAFWILLPGLALGGDRPPVFRELDFNAAVAAAAAEEKVVMIDFYTDWCIPCRKLKQTTWVDAAVVEWLEAKTVPIQINADVEIDLAKRFKVSSYPTILFVDGKGTEKARLNGYKSPQDFLQAGPDALEGIDEVARARMALKGKEQDPMARNNLALAMHRRGMYAEALEEYLWCYDEGAALDPGYIGVRNSSLVSSLESLAKVHPPARQAIDERLDKMANMIRVGEANDRLVRAFSSLARRSPERPIDLYRELREAPENAKSAALLAEALLPELIKKRLYKEVAADLGDIVETRIERRVAMVAQSSMRMSSDQLTMMTEGAVRYSGNYYELLVGAGETERAWALAEQVLKMDSSAKTWGILVTRAARAGDTQTAESLAERGLREVGDGDASPIHDAVKELTAE